MKKRITLAILLLLGTYAFGQQEENTPKHSVKGTISDTSGHTVNNVAVIVMDATDTTSIAWEYSDKEGRFQVRYPKQNGKKLLLFLQAYGYQSQYLNLQNDLTEQDLGRVILQPLHHNLDSVTVTATPDIKQQFVRGRDEFDIPQAVGNSKYDIYALLAEIPGLNVEGEKVEILGRSGGVKFTINGLEPRPGEISDLPPGDVAKVRVDRMPSARYDKSVSGVIDIVTRKKLRDYLNMRISEGFAMTCEPVTTTSVIVNGKFNRLSTYLKGQYSYGRYYQEDFEAYTLHLNGKDFERKTQRNALFISHFPNLAFSPKYQINDKSFIDLQYYYAPSKTQEETPILFEMTGIEKSLTDGQSSERAGKHNLQLRYVHGEDNTNRLVLNAGYARNLNKRHDITEESVTSVDDNTEHLYTDYRSRVTNDALTISADYEREFSESIAFSAGSSLGEIWNNARQDYVQGTSTRTETEETQVALYANFNHQIGKFNYRVGLRGEYLYKHHAKNSQANDNPFFFLPSVDVSYAFTKQIGLSLYYRRSTMYPSLGQLNPILNYLNKYEYTQGNPDLKPGVQNNFYLGVRLPHNFSIDLEYNYYKNTIMTVYQIYDAEKIQTINRPVNISSHSNFLGNISWKGKWKWYTLKLNGMVAKCWSPPLEVFDYFNPQKPHLRIKVTQLAKIAKNIYGSLGFNYLVAGEEINFRSKDQYSLSATLDMSFFERRLRVYISCDKLLHSNPHYWYHYQNVTSESKGRMFDRRFNISVSYNINRFVDWFKQNDSNADVLKRLD